MISLTKNNLNLEWRESWPKEPESILLFQAVAHFHRHNVEQMLDAFPYDEYDIKPTPKLKQGIIKALHKARRRVAWKKHNIVIRKAVAIAAMVILCMAATPTVLFALSGDFKDVVYNYIIDWRQGHVNINIDTGFLAEQTLPKYYVPAFIPDGFVLEDYIDNDLMVELYYVNDEQYFYFITYHISTGLSVDTETTIYDFEYRINGLPAIITQNRGKLKIMWQDDITIFSLETNLLLDNALEIAASYSLKEKFL